MIALGGCVGSGLLVASRSAMKNGPASLIVAWAIVSTFLYCTMQSLAELSSSYPVTVLLPLIQLNLLILVGVLPWGGTMPCFGLLYCHWNWWLQH